MFWEQGKIEAVTGQALQRWKDKNHTQNLQMGQETGRGYDREKVVQGREDSQAETLSLHSPENNVSRLRFTFGLGSPGLSSALD